MKLSLSLKFLTTLAVLTTLSSQAMAQDGSSRRDRRQAEKQANRVEQRASNVNAQTVRHAQQDVRQVQRAQQVAADHNRRNANELARQQDRARELAQRNQTRTLNEARRDVRRDNRFDSRPTANVPSRWNDRNDRNDNRWDNNNRWRTNRQIVSYNKAFRNWDAQRDYLKANMRQMNQARKLSELQQQQLNAQMQAAYLAYNNNHYNGAYNWDVYAQPQFIDYLQLNQPSLLDRILNALGIGSGLGVGSSLGFNSGVGSGLGFNSNSYLYSDNWDTERDQLAQNMSRIHQLALEGRITPNQEQELLAQLRAEYSGYRNNYSGDYGWNTYSDPGFVNYLNTSRPSILTTIRSYLR